MDKGHDVWQQLQNTARGREWEGFREVRLAKSANCWRWVNFSILVYFWQCSFLQSKMTTVTTFPFSFFFFLLHWPPNMAHNLLRTRIGCLPLLGCEPFTHRRKPHQAPTIVLGMEEVRSTIHWLVTMLNSFMVHKMNHPGPHRTGYPAVEAVTVLNVKSSNSALDSGIRLCKILLARGCLTS